MITAHQLTKSFRVHDRPPGLLASVGAVLARSHRHVQALRGVSFEVSSGARVGLLGANGAGKTTLLKLVSGLLHPSSGDLRVWGAEPWRRSSSFLCRIGFVMGHKEQLAWDLTTADTLRVNRAIYDIDASTYEARLERWSSLVDLDEVLHRQVRSLSLGQRMTCELMAALLHDPDLVILDEPTLGLDLPSQRTLRRLIDAHAQETGATVLISSHTMPDVVALAERVMVLSHGEIVFDGTLEAMQQGMSADNVVSLELARVVAPDAFRRFGTVRSAEGVRVEIVVSRPDVPTVTRALLEAFEVIDLRVAPMPIEEVVARLIESPPEGAP